MTFDPTKPVQTRNGRAARIICTDVKGEWPIIALVTDGQRETVLSYKKSGSAYDDKREDRSDLVNAPECVWVNVYRSKNGEICVDVWGSEPRASKESMRIGDNWDCIVTAHKIELP